MAVWYRLLLVVFAVVVTSQKCKFLFLVDVANINNLDPDLIEGVNETLQQINNHTIVNGYIILKRNITIHDKLIVNSTLDFWTKRSNVKRRVFSIKMDVCNFLATANKNTALSILLQSFRKHTNDPVVCPLQAHHNYTLRNWYLDGQSLPCYTLPEGKFESRTTYIMKNKKVLNIVVRGRVIY